MEPGEGDTDMRPLISFVAPSHRTYMWKPFFTSIVTGLEFEVIFVTDVQPKPEEIPDHPNFHWYFSTVKPGQCFEIAYRKSVGDFVCWTGDDFTYDNFHLDSIYKFWQDKCREHGNERGMVGFDIFQDGEKCNHMSGQPQYPFTTTGIIPKKLIEEVGGFVDPRFCCGIWDCDLMFRILASGGWYYTDHNSFARERHKEFHAIEANFSTVHDQEEADLYRIWDFAKLIRHEPVQRFSDENIMTISQGFKGKWS